MNEPAIPEEQAQFSPVETTAALFANMVVQQTNMALMFLGQVPHPESGKHVRDLDAARMFIDQLEMLDVKTKGNLDKREEALLKRSLTALRMAFVAEANQKPPASPEKASPPTAPQPADAPTARGTTASSAESATPGEETESRKKFSKKY